MASTGQIHVNDVGTAFRATVKDEDGNVLNVSAATRKEIWFSKPDGETVAFDADFFTDGADGMVQYVTAAGDLDQRGRWKVQGVVALNGGLWHSDVQTFKVWPNLRSD